MSELEPTLEYRILGPLEMVRDEEVFPLGGTKPGEVLAVLLVHLNQPVSAELLIDALWGERPPTTARKSVQTHVWLLRKTLAPDGLESPSSEVIRTSGSGYVLEADPDQVDALRFEALVNEALDHLDDGDGYHARAAAEEALSLWRGRALEGLDDRPILKPEVTRLEELYVRALEIRAEGRLLAGEHLEMVPDLRRLVADFPYRERLWEHLCWLCTAPVARPRRYGRIRRCGTSWGASWGSSPGPGCRVSRSESSVVIRAARVRRPLGR